MLEVLWINRIKNWSKKIVAGEVEFQQIVDEITDGFNNVGLELPKYDHILPIARSVASGHQVIPQHCNPNGPHENIHYTLENFEEIFHERIDINCLTENQATIAKMNLSEKLKPMFGHASSALVKLKRGDLCERADCSNYASLWDKATGQVFCPDHFNGQRNSESFSESSLNEKDSLSRTSPSGVASMTSSVGMRESHERVPDLSNSTSPSLSKDTDNDVPSPRQDTTGQKFHPPAESAITPTHSSIFSSPSSLGMPSTESHPSTKISSASKQSMNTNNFNGTTLPQGINGKCPDDDTVEVELSQPIPRKVISSTVEYLDVVFGVELWNDVVEDIELGNQKCTSKKHGLYNMACSYAPRLLVSLLVFLSFPFPSLPFP